MWTRGGASYPGEFADFDRFGSCPTPLQGPPPPVLVGGEGPTVLDRVLAFGDAWFPTLRDGAGTLERIWCWPKPAQRPYPPVLVGGNGPTVLDRVLAFGDAWFPNHAREAVLDRIPELHRRAADAGRRVAVHVMGVPDDPRVLERYEEAGVTSGVFWVPSAARSVVERAMERFEHAVAELHGE